MREILFRGKLKHPEVHEDVCPGGWMEGYVFDNDSTIEKRMYVGNLVIEPAWAIDHGEPVEDHDIVGSYFSEVRPETVGQYTGLIDRNGKKVFEGDIVSMHYFEERDGYEADIIIVAQIGIDSLGVTFKSKDVDGYLCDYLEEPEEELEVIGNVFDNPDMLEVK